MDKIHLAVVDRPRKRSQPWVVFTISDGSITQVDTACNSFKEVYRKYGFVRLYTTEGMTGMADG